MTLLIPAAMPAESVWTNSFIVGSATGTDVTLTVKTKQATITCRPTAILAAIAEPALTASDLEAMAAAPAEAEKTTTVPEGGL